MSTSAWKDLERDAAQALGGKRITEPWQLFRERPDVVVEAGAHRLICDCKRYQRHAHHRHLEKVQARYCQSGRDVPCIVTREPGGEAYASIPLTYLARLLSDSRRLHELRGEDAPEHVASILERMAS